MAKVSKTVAGSRRITRESLMTLEAYARERKQFRARVIEHKRARTLHLGDHVTLLFEDELTIRYQVQEMLRIEKIFDEEGIQSELAAYNPLIPDGHNFKTTMLIEYDDAEERHRALAALRGIERKMWLQVEGCPRVFAIADEDLEREDEEKTSSVHFLRFELTKEMGAALKYGVALGFGIDHPSYHAEIPAVDAATRQSLIVDLE
jgi:predicted acylesterase/phospholipase RssA